MIIFPKRRTRGEQIWTGHIRWEKTDHHPLNDGADEIKISSTRYPEGEV
jgi:hypothetical protein